MHTLYEVFTILGMFILRLGVPLAITVGVGYLLRRLDRSWETEADERRRTIEASMAAAHLPQVSVIETPCWELRSCPPQVREHCPAYNRPAVACWIARYQAEGRLPSLCVECLPFTTARQAALDAAD